MRNEPGNLALGEARHNDAFIAAQQAAQQAYSALNRKASWGLAFGGGRHDPSRLLAGLRSVVGDIPIVGGSALGLITAQGATATGFECGLMLFGESLAPGAIVTESGLCDTRVTGERLGTALRVACPEVSTILLLYDSVHSTAPHLLHLGSPLVEGFRDGLGAPEPAIIGAGTLSQPNLETSVVFNGREPCQHTAVAVAMPRQLVSHIRITHGCQPASDFMTITRIDGAHVLELDGRPASIVAAERLGLSHAALMQLTPPALALALGEKQGDPFAPFDEENYKNRLVVAAEDETKALVLFEADFAVGTRVQLMDIDPQRMIDSAWLQTEQLLASLGEATPLFGLYIDCAGRSTVFSGMDEDESAPVRRLIGERCPMLGFFSGVEIAPVQGRSRPLDWTGVIAVFTATD